MVITSTCTVHMVAHESTYYMVEYYEWYCYLPTEEVEECNVYDDSKQERC